MSRIFLHVVTDSYRMHLLTSLDGQGKLILGLEKPMIECTGDLADDYSPPENLKYHHVLDCLSRALCDHRIRDIYLIGVEDVEFEEVMKIIYGSMLHMKPNLHIITVDESSIPYEFKLICEVKRYSISTLEERRQILANYIHNEESLERAARLSEGLSLSEVEVLGKLLTIGVEIHDAIARLKTEKLRHYGMEILPKIDSKIPVDENVLDAIESVATSHPRVSIMLAGLTGSGKTTIGKRALSSRVPAVLVKSSDLVQSILKKRTMNYWHLIEVIESLNPGGILIDQFDVLSGKLGLDHLLVTDGILKWLEERRFGMLVGTTVNIDAIDPQMVRPGRFDAVILVPPPDHALRKKILAYYGVREREAGSLASHYPYYTPADLMFIARQYLATGKPPEPNLAYMKRAREEYIKLVSYVSKMPNGMVLRRVVD